MRRPAGRNPGVSRQSSHLGERQRREVLEEGVLVAALIWAVCQFRHVCLLVAKDKRPGFPGVEARYYGLNSTILGAQGVSHLDHFTGIAGDLLDISFFGCSFQDGEDNIFIDFLLDA